MKKSVKIWIILGIIAVLIIAAVLYFFVFSKGSGFNIPGMDYSAGTNVGDNLEKATDVNVFDKLNPFR
jgi:flagellar basal body-associated protein FliL